MEWNGLISQFEQAESNPGLVTLIKGALQQSSLPSPAAKSHLHSRNVIPVNSVRNSYSDTRLEACSLVLSFTYPSKMVRISRFSPADPSVETALQGMFPILNFLWVRDCAPWVGGWGGKAVPRSESAFLVARRGDECSWLPPGEHWTQLLSHLLNLKSTSSEKEGADISSRGVKDELRQRKKRKKKKEQNTAPAHGCSVLLHFPCSLALSLFLFTCLPRKYS